MAHVQTSQGHKRFTRRLSGLVLSSPRSSLVSPSASGSSPSCSRASSSSSGASARGAWAQCHRVKCCAIGMIMNVTCGRQLWEIGCTNTSLQLSYHHHHHHHHPPPHPTPTPPLPHLLVLPNPSFAPVLRSVRRDREPSGTSAGG